VRASILPSERLTSTLKEKFPSNDGVCCSEGKIYHFCVLKKQQHFGITKTKRLTVSGKSADPILHRELPLLKNGMTGDFKNYSLLTDGPRKYDRIDKKLFREISLVSRNSKNSEILFRFVLFRQG
jgi:hypothetical protein